MPVSTQHPDYIKAAPRYKLIRDIIANDAQCHIRSPEPENPSSFRNVQYKQDAVLTNFTKITSKGLTGLVFRKKLRVSLPVQIDYLLENITGTGINIYQFSQHTTEETLNMGRYGLLADYYGDGSKAYLKPYCPESIVNWGTRLANGVTSLSFVSLCEYITADTSDLFNQNKVKQYRVLRLDEDGLYVQDIYDAANNYQYSYEIYNYKGKRFKYIPFYFIGSENNDWEVDEQPLYDLAVLNRSHYQNSADYEESIWINGQLYLVIDPGEVSEQDFLNSNGGSIAYGSRKALVLGPGGKAQLLQANPNQLVAQAMNEKLEQAAKIGARLIEPAGGRETAEAAKIRYGSQHSILYTLTNNVEWGIQKALKALCEFMGANPEAVKFVLNKDFYEDTADPQIIAQQMIGLEAGVVTKEEIRDYGLRTGILSEQEELQ